MEVRKHLASQVVRSAKACESCAKSKQRCQGGSPCVRCIKRGLECRAEHNESLEGQDRTEPSRDLAESDLNSASLEDCSTSFQNSDESLGETNLNQQLISLQGTILSGSELPTLEASLHENMSIDGNYPMAYGADPHGLYSLDTSAMQWNQLDNMPFINWFFQDSQTQVDITNLASHESTLNPSEGPTSAVEIAPQLDSPFHSTNSTKETSLFAPSGYHVQSNIPRFPDLLPSDHEGLVRDNFCHVQRVSATAYAVMKNFFEDPRDVTYLKFPHIETTHSFVELYFEYFDEDLPCVHTRQVELEEASWILLLAVASVGAQYSAISNAKDYVKCLQACLEEAIREHVSKFLSYYGQICS